LTPNAVPVHASQASTGAGDPRGGMDRLGANPANSSPLALQEAQRRERARVGRVRDCPSVVYHDTVFTWSQTHRRCLRLASALASLGISRGDIVSPSLSFVPARGSRSLIW